jgi:aryl-alcohol dehydrogenase-like predicted oxidoreductase
VRSGKGTLDRHSIERAVEGSLKRLGTDYIDLYQTHWPDPELAVEETLRGLENVVRSGKVRYVGCSNETAYGLTRALMVSDYEKICRYDTIQNNFSLLNRRFDDELKTVCRREQVSLLAYSPLGGGVLSGKYKNGSWPEGARFTSYRSGDRRNQTMTRRFVNDRTLETVERLTKVAADCEVSLVTFAVAWVLSRDYVGAAIIGATRPEQLDESLAAVGVNLPAEALKACDELTREILYPMG